MTGDIRKIGLGKSIFFQLGLLVAFLAVACGTKDPKGGTPRPREVKRVREARYVMGTVLTITIEQSTREQARSALDAAFSSVQTLDNLLSHYNAKSEVSTLSHIRESPSVVSPSTRWILERSRDLKKLTGGAFDYLADEGMITSGSNIQFLENGKAYLPGPEYRVNLGGIGKGYAVDVVVRALKNAGIESALIDFGRSSFFALGNPKEEESWTVLLREPGLPERTFHVRNQALSTSVRSSIIDPRTGMKTKRARGAYVVAPSATVADALTTALVVDPTLLGNKRLRAMVRDACVFITSEKSNCYETGEALPTDSQDFPEFFNFP